ncbi:hypothetical protein [Oceanobacillus polygoni]|uniref:Sporulation and spore germination protein n=1 Tax=Oceanobacillus polygoni TaxID=1235259 RepID=A0A9X0YTB5_9BACI|nr:hypothetical protein [Oceanobacillus polygoni]MBP2077827.1 hypothetical protein [Oceanobacillus polygoni]
MRNNEDYEKIIADLKQLPVIEDKTDKSVLYSRISSKMADSQKVKSKKQIKIVPILATGMVAVLLALIPFILNSTSDQRADQSINHDVATTYDYAEESDQVGSSEEQEANSGEATENSQEEALQQSNELRIAMDEVPTRSHVISADADELLVYGAVADAKNQYVIPISFIVEESADVLEYYNQMAAYIQEDSWNTAEYVLEGASFELNEADKEVLIELKDGFTLGEGSAHAYVFEQMLASMFTPLGIEKAIFKDGVDLGPIGFIEEMPLNQGETLYKLYNNEFLIPVPTSNELSIEEALVEMNLNEPEFNVAQTIPDEIQLEVQSSGSLLELTFDDVQEFTNEQDAVTMIEAILMTAKSYGFENVQFHNPPMQQISGYNLAEPINVPRAVNPVDLRDE